MMYVRRSTSRRGSGWERLLMAGAIALEAAPQMAAEFGGLDPEQRPQAVVDQIGKEVVQGSPATSTPYEFDFHLLEDQQTINAFALPGARFSFDYKEQATSLNENRPDF